MQIEVPYRDICNQDTQKLAQHKAMPLPLDISTMTYICIFRGSLTNHDHRTVVVATVPVCRYSVHAGLGSSEPYSRWDFGGAAEALQDRGGHMHLRHDCWPTAETPLPQATSIPTCCLP